MPAVRRTTPADVEAWARLRVALMVEDGHLAPGDDRDALTGAIEDWLRERIASPTFGAFVAEVDGTVVASGGITVYDSPPGPALVGREAYVMSMYTDPAHRGRGVAGALLAALLDFAREAGGVYRVWLRASDMGRSVYAGAGFEPRGTYMQLYL